MYAHTLQIYVWSKETEVSLLNIKDLNHWGRSHDLFDGQEFKANDHLPTNGLLWRACTYDK